MASGDYRSCDVCGCKCFYDASLNYEWPEYRDRPKDYIKKEIFFNGKPAEIQLDYLGAWAVLCTDCSKTHEAIIISKEARALLGWEG